jgi:TetR/AcrR family transcriptional regulator, transcriptional repressor of bet genes
MKRCVLRNGLQPTTLREISREAGFTTGVISYYFPDKESVVQLCFETISNDWLGAVQSRLAQMPDARAKMAVLVDTVFPADPEAQSEWRLWSEMWTYAGGQRDFACALVEIDGLWEAEVLALLRQAGAEKLLRPVDDLDLQAHILVRLVDGLGLRAWLSHEWQQARQTLAHHLGSLINDPALVAELAKVAAAPWSRPGNQAAADGIGA